MAQEFTPAFGQFVFTLCKHVREVGGKFPNAQALYESVQIMKPELPKGFIPDDFDMDLASLLYKMNDMFIAWDKAQRYDIPETYDIMLGLTEPERVWLHRIGKVMPGMDMILIEVH